MDITFLATPVTFILAVAMSPILPREPKKKLLGMILQVILFLKVPLPPQEQHGKSIIRFLIKTELLINPMEQVEFLGL